jgi:hypothetical protein
MSHGRSIVGDRQGGPEEAERLIGVRNRDEGEARSPTA